MKFPFFITVFLSAAICSAQQTITETLVHDGLQRSYILYIPASYDPGDPTPLVMNFHGYTSNSNDQMWYGDFRPIADTAGFLVVHPMGTVDDTGQPYWNANWGGDVDDIGFTSALIDHLAMNYSIDLDRVYSTGMSNGGFMSYTLACELSHRIAAIASVTGTMTVAQVTGLDPCQPVHSMPIMEIHGTADGTVPYVGNTWMGAIDDVMDFWTNINNCSNNPTIFFIPDIDGSDGSSVEHYIYSGGDNGVEVEHFKIVGGSHTWPGSVFNSPGTNYDIRASNEIWRFFRKYNINGRILSSGTEMPTYGDTQILMHPNPVIDVLTFDWTTPNLRSILIVNALGQEIWRREIIDVTRVDVSFEDQTSGVYFALFRNAKNEVMHTLRIARQ